QTGREAVLRPPPHPHRPRLQGAMPPPVALDHAVAGRLAAAVYAQNPHRFLCYAGRAITIGMKCRIVLAMMLMVAAVAAQKYSQQDVMTPMRDGVRLHTLILTPPGEHGKLPFLITRTPYGATARLLSAYPVMAATDGYIFIMQDIRGRYGSEGQFVMQRPPRDRANPKSIDEGTDTYDTIAWLLKNIPNNNGRAGLVGISYGGWLTTMALIEPHPALKAASEQASPDNMFVNDDFHHQGAFRLSYGFEYAAMMETGKT